MSVRSWLLLLTASALAVSGQALASASIPAPATQGAVVSRSWGPVRVLTPNPFGESLLVDAHNVTTVVWGHQLPPRHVVAVRRTANGSWGKKVVIGHGFDPQAAADAQGNVTVVWFTHRDGYPDGVAMAEHPAGGHWSDPGQLSHDVKGPGGANQLHLAVSPSGAAVVAWAWASRTPSRIRSVYRPAGGQFGPQVDVTPATGASSPEVGIAGNGTVIMVYGRQSVGHPQVLQSRVRRAGAGWTDPTVVAKEGYTQSLGVDRAGNAVVVYTPNFNRVVAAHRPAGGSWQAARALSPKGVEVGAFALAMNGRGTALVAIARNSGRVDLVRRPAPGPWAAPRRVTAAGTPTDAVVVGLNEVGDTFVGWGSSVLLGKYRPHDGAWGRRFTISPFVDAEVLEWTYAEVAPGGGVAVLWKQEDLPLKVRWMTAS